MTDTKNIVALCMKYMFYFILMMISISFVIEIFENIGIRFIHIKSQQLFYISAIFVCISPFIWAILFIFGYLFKKKFKAALLGILLITVLILSFFMKNIA